LLRRLRQTYGPRFFDLVVVDSWYANGPFLKTVVEELGWPVVAVLKQERYDIYQEALALTRGKPTQVVERGEAPNQRQVEIWDVPALRFSDTYTHPVRVARVRERWPERTQQGKAWLTVAKEQTWICVVAGDLDTYDGAAIRDFGLAFNGETQTIKTRDGCLEKIGFLPPPLDPNALAKPLFGLGCGCNHWIFSFSGAESEPNFHSMRPTSMPVAPLLTRVSSPQYSVVGCFLTGLPNRGS